MKKLLFTLLGLAAALTLPAQDFKITHGPWLCDMTEDGVTVLWTTTVSYTHLTLPTKLEV